MIRIISAIGFAVLFFYWLYKLAYSDQESAEELRLKNLYHEANSIYPRRTKIERLTALYESRGRVLVRMRDLMSEEKRRQCIQDRIILGQEIARLTVEDAEIISDFELIQQPFIQQ